ncbi:MAG: hypothetical protein ACRDSS_02150, partial [Actinocrinis sp.]
MAQHWGSGSPSGERRLAEEFDLALIGAGASGADGDGASHRGPRRAAQPAQPTAQTATMLALTHRIALSRDGAVPPMDEV